MIALSPVSVYAYHVGIKLFLIPSKCIITLDSIIRGNNKCDICNTNWYCSWNEQLIIQLSYLFIRDYS